MAPEWQIINSNNWVTVEAASRQYTINLGRSLDVWTGVWDRMKLDDDKGDWQEIFLDFDESRNPQGRIQAPKIYYKVLIDTQKNTGVVLVGKFL